MQLESLEFWMDHNLPPQMALWLRHDFNGSAKSFLELNLQTADDRDVFQLAVNHKSGVVITTKDIDYLLLSETQSIPKILYTNVGKYFKQKTQADNL